MKPAAIIANCLAQQAAADSRAALDYATGCSVGTVLALFAAGLLSADECDAGTTAARAADRARRLAWDAARVAAFAADPALAGAHSCPQTAHNPATNAPLSAIPDHFPGPENEHSPTHAEGAGEPHAQQTAPADAGAYVVTAEADESGERLYVAGPFASYTEADELAAALQEDSDQWAEDDPLLCTSHVRYRVERLADLQDTGQPGPQQDATPALEPQAWGFLGLAYCLGDCLGDVAANPPTEAERSMLRGMAASALRAWQAVHAEHGEELASLHDTIRHAEQVGAHSVGAVSVDLLRLLIGEGVRHG
ncbi:hypothetical protein [Azotobacter chroococcum]|uniref:Uncharacterized protein n=1 Tax=Azotobacter chroococcum TaxID=353 RepID=A0AAP9YDK6_9GAMM|nr:hypothetical protein [Azotobacter chroococcum]QQE88540.1 hypothetical protein GKQ51_20280 [Azotobacter chroococcum]